MELKKYIGRPYEEYNCLDLVKEFYLDHFDLQIKNYYEEGSGIPSRHEVCSLIKTNRGDFVEIPEKDKMFGDLVVIKLYGIECHLGVVVADHMFLHSSKNTGSIMDRMSRYSKLIAGYYRHRDLVK